MGISAAAAWCVCVWHVAASFVSLQPADTATGAVPHRPSYTQRVVVSVLGHATRVLRVLRRLEILFSDVQVTLVLPEGPAAGLKHRLAPGCP